MIDLVIIWFRAVTFPDFHFTIVILKKSNQDIYRKTEKSNHNYTKLISVINLYLCLLCVVFFFWQIQLKMQVNPLFTQSVTTLSDVYLRYNIEISF